MKITYTLNLIFLTNLLKILNLIVNNNTNMQNQKLKFTKTLGQ